MAIETGSAGEDIGRHEADARRMEQEAEFEEDSGRDFGGYNELGGTPYTHEDNLFRVRLSSTDYLPAVLEYITKAHLSYKAKTVLIQLVRSLFDRNVFYANIVNQDMVRNKVEEMILMTRLAMTKTDINRPEYINVIDAIKFQFGITMTRTTGPLRERLIQRPEQRVVQGVDTYADGNGGEPKKKGFWYLPGFG